MSSRIFPLPNPGDLKLQKSMNLSSTTNNDDKQSLTDDFNNNKTHNIPKGEEQKLQRNDQNAQEIIFTPRTALANSVNNFVAKKSEVEGLFAKYRALVPNCVVDKYMREAKKLSETQSTKKIEISAYAESYWSAVLFADISGFSKLAEKLQKELGEGAKAAETLSKYVGKSLDIMVKLITSNCGDVIKFAGDAIFLVLPVK